jgi:mycofactocin system glycosyltransferase
MAAIEAGDMLPPGHEPLTRRLVDAGVLHPEPGSPTRFGLDDVTMVVPSLGGGLPTGDLPPRVVLVDDGSQPPLTAEPTVRVVRRGTTGGPATARRDGLAEVTTTIVAFVDADMVLPEGWWRPLLAHFDDTAVAAVAPRVRSAPAPGVVGRYDRDRSPLDLGPLPGRVAPGTRLSYVPSATLLCRVDAVRDVGGFDPALRFGEDVDLVWRLVATGHRVRYEPASVVEHPPRRDLPAMLRQRAGYGSAAAPLADRHPDALAPAVMSAWSALVVALVVARRPVAAVAVAAATGAALQRKLDGVPAEEAWRLVARGHVGALGQAATAVRRVWWPLVLAAALVSPRARAVLVSSFVVHPLVRWATSRPRSVDPVTAVVVGALDDTAYGWGTWRGMLRSGQWRPLWPRLSGWPPRADR